MGALEPRVVWWVIVDRAAEDLWRASLGQADIDAWCAAHGWDSEDVGSESVMVTGYEDGRVEVMADIYDRNRDGNRFRRGQHVASHFEIREYRRPLPEGIATVNRPAPFPLAEADQPHGGTR